MKTLATFLSCVLLLTSSVFAQPKAIIKGPDEVLAGTLLNLSSGDSVGDFKVWIIPDELKKTSMSCGDIIFFSIPTPGTYKFGLIASDKTGIDYIFHQVVVKGSGTKPPPVDPPPAGSYKALKEASINGLKQLQDWPTVLSLKNSLKDTTVAMKTLTFDDKVKAVQTTVGLVLGGRSRESYRTKDWETLWRVPINKELIVISATEYQQAMEALVETLEPIPPILNSSR